MRKISQILMVTMFVLFLGACSKGVTEEKTIYENNSNEGIKSVITYYHTGDKVSKQTTENSIKYKEAGLQDKETAKKAMEAAGSNLYKDVKGVEYSLTYQDNEVTEELTIDYGKLDYDSAAKIPGFQVSGNTDNGVSLKESEKLLQANGYTKK